MPTAEVVVADSSVDGSRGLMRRRVVARLVQPADSSDDRTGLADFAAQLGAIFADLSREVKAAGRLRLENHALREQNRSLRLALAECVEACGEFLGPALEGESAADEADHVRARRSLGQARRVLDDATLLPGPTEASPVVE